MVRQNLEDFIKVVKKFDNEKMNEMEMFITECDAIENKQALLNIIIKERKRRLQNDEIESIKEENKKMDEIEQTIEKIKHKLKMQIEREEPKEYSWMSLTPEEELIELEKEVRYNVARKTEEELDWEEHCAKVLNYDNKDMVINAIKDERDYRKYKKIYELFKNEIVSLDNNEVNNCIAKVLILKNKK